MKTFVEILATVSARGDRPFTAGIVLWDDKVVETAPIVRRFKGWTRDRVRAYCHSKGWSVSVVYEMVRPDTSEKGRLARSAGLEPA